MPIAVSFVVQGKPATKGSTVSFMGEYGIVTKADCGTLAAWSQAVGWAAKVARVPFVPRPWPVTVRATVRLVRPASAKRRPAPTVKPDADKVLRALLDALSGIAFEDDAQVVKVVMEKVYGDRAETVVTVESGGTR